MTQREIYEKILAGVGPVFYLTYILSCRCFLRDCDQCAIKHNVDVLFRHLVELATKEDKQP